MGGEVCLPRIHNHAYTSELNRCMLHSIPRTHLSNYVEKLIQLMKNGDRTIICENDIVNEYVLQIEISFLAKLCFLPIS